MKTPFRPNILVPARGPRLRSGVAAEIFVGARSAAAEARAGRVALRPGRAPELGC